MVSQFIAHLFVQNLSPATIASYISAISFMHKANNFNDPTNSFIIQKILKGVQNLRGHADSRLPITGQILQKLVVALPKVNTHVFQHTMLKSMFCLAFYAFLRIGEIAVKNKNDIKVIMRNDIHFHYNNNIISGATIVMKKFKHSDHPKTIFLPCDLDNPICPVQALKTYVDMAGHSEGPLFCFPCGSPVPYTFFCSNLKLALAFNNLDPKLYKGHSFRIGAATSAAARGVPLSVIQNMGRWKSDAFKNYIRMHNFQV